MQATAEELTEAEAGLVSQQLQLLHNTALHGASDSHQGPLGQCVCVHALVCEEDILRR